MHRAFARLTVSPFFAPTRLSNRALRVASGCSSLGKRWGVKDSSTQSTARAWRNGLGAFLLTAFISAHAQQMPSAQTATASSTHAAASSNDLPMAPNNPATSSTDASAPPGDAQSSNVYKNMSLQELMNQNVTSVSGTPQPYGEAPAAIQVITNNDILRSGASSLPEALRLADNLEVAQDNAHDWNISARGFNAMSGDKLLVLIDGRAVYTPILAGVSWDVENVMLEDLDRIEVVSGPGGTLWGANAMNGVINIVSKSAQDTQGWYMEGAGGSELRDAGAIRYGGTLAPDVYYRVYGTYFDRNGEVYTDGAAANDAWSEGRGGFRIDTAGSSDDKYMLEGEYYNGAAGDPSFPSTNETEVESGGHLLGRWTHTFSADSDMSLQVYYDRVNSSTPEPASAFAPTVVPAGIATEYLDTADVSFQHNIQVGDRNKVTWGAGYRFYHDVADNSPAVEILPATQDLNVFNIFGQDEIKLLDNLFFTLGTKVEHNDFTHFEYEPSARLQWNFTPTQMLWAAVSRAVRTPSIGERSLYEPTGLPDAPLPHPPFPPGYSYPQSLLDGSTSFTSEKLLAYELGYRAQLDSQISGSISTFYNFYSDIRSTSLSSASTLDLPIYLQNNLQGETYGIEVSSDYQMLDWWRWHAGYDYLQEHIHVAPGQIDFTNALNETADPKNQVFLRSSMDLPENMDFDLNGRFIDSLTINNAATAASVPSYFELDARLAWHPTKDLEISIVGQNLLQGQHAEYGFPGPDQVQIERSVYGKIAWHF
ncbi:MAG: TonB-dependent receptor [Methylacidiphilales bacterium]|nr:TonB-dependent receptor [Candidatus Methylacidiphilales bacterium]